MATKAELLELLRECRGRMERGCSVGCLADRIDAVLKDEQKPEPEGRTVRVRIAVAINADKDWYAWGEAGVDDQEMVNEVVGNVPDGQPIMARFIEADVPLPEVRTVEGEVVE